MCYNFKKFPVRQEKQYVNQEERLGTALLEMEPQEGPLRSWWPEWTQGHTEWGRASQAEAPARTKAGGHPEGPWTTGWGPEAREPGRPRRDRGLTEAGREALEGSGARKRDDLANSYEGHWARASGAVST